MDNKKATTKKKFGYDNFKKEFLKKNEGRFSGLIEANDSMRESWRKLSNAEQERYRNMASLDGRGKESASCSTAMVSFNTRCSPGQFKEVVEYISKHKRLCTKVKKMGFQSLLDFKFNKLPRELCEQVIAAFDTPTSTLGIGGKKLSVDGKDVHTILGVPYGGKVIFLDDDSKACQALKKNYLGKPFTELKSLVISGKAEKNFETVFLLFTLGTFLCPTTSTTVCMRSIKSLSGKKNVQEYDWSSFVLSELIREISTYKTALRSGRKKKNVGGCLFFLLIFYMHHFPLGPTPSIDSGTPVMHLWNQHMVQKRVKLEKESIHGILYGGQANEVSEVLPPLATITHPDVREIYEDFLQYDNTFASKVLKLQQSLNQLQISDSKAIMRVGEPSEEEVEEEDYGDKNEAEDNEDGDKGEDEAKDAHEAGDEDGDEDEDDDGHETAARAGSKEDEDEGSNSKEESDERQDGKKRRRIDERLMVMSMVAKVMVGEQLHEGKVWRYIFDSEFMATLRDKKLRWSVFEDAKMLMPDQLGYNLGNCDYLFLPMLVFNHWFCYCADLKNDKFFILDSLAGKLFKEKKMMAGFMRTSIIELLQACDPEKYGEDFQMEMIFEELPKQSNVDDCRVYVIKYCTKWDGRRRKGGLTMEDFSNEQLRQFRVDVVWWLVNHTRNEVRNEVFASVSAANRPKRAGKECRLIFRL
ncbi:uncharacterized protein LOC129310735 [Prosopis cineraria]|uniref:uncharacterized protein LOC129310735 n=1 Tax=Prosopis cineraria TaxID=364024 RepID=UPI0024108ECC|nr:uncharacterized protein LOC129310735 [Prosopis cineraria]